MPASLAKRGFTGVTHNLQPGQEVNWVTPLFWAFREELEARFLKPAPRPAAALEPEQG
ncbi:MAG: hypothetical protein Q8S32_17370 [Burkholderiaceae bacterium]|nr:hypothetical protein [Burkholderiaceae bacterium]